jgi:hypothetical protein
VPSFLVEGVMDALILISAIALGTGLCLLHDHFRDRIRVRLLCHMRGHDTIPLKRIGRDSFVVHCMRCGHMYLKTSFYPDGPEYTLYRGQFDEFTDYAEEEEEAEPTFVDDDGATA